MDYFNHFITLVSNVKFLFGFSLLLMLLTLATLIYQLDKGDRSSYMFADMLMEEGRASMTKFAQFIALVISSWGFIAQVLSDRLTEWYFGLFMTAWVLNRGLTKYLESKNTVVSPPDTKNASGTN